MTRPGDWNCMVSGGEFWPLDPRAEEVHITDIAHALSNVCRFAGHTTEFYSVAQHSVLVTLLLLDFLREQNISPAVPRDSVPLLLTGLLHDAGEAYVGDMTRPLKRCEPMGPMFCEIEDRIYAVVAEKYGALHPLPDIVKRADNVLLVTEVRDLMPGLHRRSWSKPDVVPLPHRVTPWSPNTARDRFLEMFHDLTQ